MSRWMIVLVLAACSSKTPSPEPTGPSATPPKLQPPKPSAPKCEPRPPGAADPKLSGCHADADCKDGKNPRCNKRGGGHALEMNRCEYDECTIDDDCGAKGTCNCDTEGAFCIPGNCRSDNDCPEGTCGDTRGCGYRIDGHYCHKKADACQSDEDCQKTDPSTHCGYSPETNTWACAKRNCPVG